MMSSEKSLIVVATISLLIFAVFSNSAIKIPEASAATCENLKIDGAKVSGYKVNYGPVKTLDNKLHTYWSHDSTGAWIRAAISNLQTICNVDIAWYKGDSRQYDFVISVSLDGTVYQDVFEGTSSGATTSLERYDFEDSEAKFVKIAVSGNDVNNLAEIAELRLSGHELDIAPVTDPDKPLLIQVFAITTDLATQTVIKEHLDSEDSISNYRLPVFGKFQTQQHMLNEASIQDIKTAISTDIPKGGQRVDYITYNNEGWTLTPISEQNDPASATNTAAALAKAAGYKFAATPTHRMLMQELYGVDWTKVDALTMQVQKLVGTSTFAEKVLIASSHVKSQNPDILVFAQVNPDLNTTAEIVNSIDSVRGNVDGVAIIWRGTNAAQLDNLLTALAN